MNDERKRSLMNVALGILSRESLFVYVCPQMDPTSVLIPPRLLSQRQVVLQLGYNMPIPIPDLLVTEVGISGTLMFKQVPFECFIPWECVIGLVSENDYNNAHLNGGKVRPAHIPMHDDGRAGGQVISLDEWRRKKQGEREGA